MKTQKDWSPWRDKRFLLFASGNFIDNVGNSIYNVSLTLLLYDVTKSLMVMSLVVAMQPISLLMAPIFGALADRYGSRVLVVPGLVLQLFAALGINIVAFGGHGSLHRPIGLTILMFLVFFVELGGNAYRRGWMNGLPGMFGECAAKARGSQYTLYVASTIVGPAVLAVGLPFLGYKGLLWINMLSYIAPMLVWWLGVRPPKRIQQDGFHFNLFGFYRDLGEGWRILRSKPQLSNYLVVLLPFTFATAVDALITYFLRDTWELSSQYVAVIFGLANIASFIGSLWVSEQKKLRLRVLLAVAVGGSAIALLLFPTPLLPVVLGAVMLNALFIGAFGATDGMLVVTFAPESAFGRISGINLLLSGIPAFVSPLISPLIQHVIGIRPTFAVLGAIACMSVLWIMRKWGVWAADSSIKVEKHESGDYAG